MSRSKTSARTRATRQDPPSNAGTGSRTSGPTRSSGFPRFVPVPDEPAFLQSMAGTSVQIKPVELLQIPDAPQGHLAEWGLAVEGMQHDALQQVSQGQVVIVRRKPSAPSAAVFRCALRSERVLPGKDCLVPWYISTTAHRPFSRLERSASEIRGPIWDCWKTDPESGRLRKSPPKKRLERGLASKPGSI